MSNHVMNFRAWNTNRKPRWIRAKKQSERNRQFEARAEVVYAQAMARLERNR